MSFKGNSLLLSLFLILISVDCFSSETRPVTNTGKGFFVKNGKLYDARGNEFIPIGVNGASAWQPFEYAVYSFPQIKWAGANCLRINSYSTSNENRSTWAGHNLCHDYFIRLCIENKLVPILTFHDTTCGRAYHMTISKHLQKVVESWCSDEEVAMCKMYEESLIVNIGNEWGEVEIEDVPEAKSYLWDGPPIKWVDGYKLAIKAMRDAGIKNTLMIDAGGNCGQNPTSIVKYAQQLLDFDPQHNIIFDIHFYGFWQTGDHTVAGWQFSVDYYLQKFSELKLPVVVGEYGWTGTSEVTYTPEHVISETNKRGIGNIFFNWFDAADSPNFNIVSSIYVGYTTDNDLTDYGKHIVEHLRTNAIEASIFNTSDGLVSTNRDKKDIVLFQNPLAPKQLNVRISGSKASAYNSLRIFNTIGEVVYNYQITSDNSFQLNLSNLASGTYFLHFYGDQSDYSSKIIL